MGAIKYVTGYRSFSLFDYIVVRPNKAALRDKKALSGWTEEETKREEMARRNAGVYAELNALQALSFALQQRMVALAMRSDALAGIKRVLGWLRKQLNRVWPGGM